MPKKFVFLILPHLHLLDLAGPDQAIHEAIDFGADFTLEYCGIDSTVHTSAGLAIGKQKHFTKIILSEGDFLIIPGASMKYIRSKEFKNNNELFNWISSLYQSNVNIVSICVGAFVLGYSGLLDGTICTTHFQLTTELKKTFPKADVKETVLYQEDKHIYSSAGIASGIDLMLHIIETLTSGYFAHKVARELVIYRRREDVSPQNNIFLQFRNHVHNGIHKVQDYTIENLNSSLKITDLANIANMSERNFTRIFRKETGCTVNDFKTRIRIEKAKSLLNNPDLSKLQIANQVGLTSEKQLIRILKNNIG
ncbi:MAG: DJ-1/PfpI family protein [Bacteroidetes bacterium]|nr:DJ-1/PfpI family protein [Bacteroidota bacterium]